MLSEDQHKAIAPKLRYVQIAAAAMIFVICVLAPVTFQISNWRFLAGTPKMLTVIAGFASLMMFSMSFSVPRIFSGSPDPDLPGKGALDSAFGMFTVETFIQFALLDGAAMMNLVVYSVEHHVVSLMFAAIAVLFMAFFFFPRASKASAVISDKLRQQVSEKASDKSE